MEARLEAAERQPLLTPEDGVEANSIDPKSVDPKTTPQSELYKQTLEGGYSLPRSFWLHGVLVSYLLLIVSCRSSIVVFVTGRESPLVGAIGLYPGLLF